MKVAVLLAEGFETIEALTTVDILRRAGVTCNTIGTKSLEVTTSHSITIKADKVLNEEVYDYDVVVLPGGMPGAVNLRDDEIYLDIKDSFLDIFEGEACDFEVDYVKEKGTPVLEDAVESLRLKAIEVTNACINKLEKKED